RRALADHNLTGSVPAVDEGHLLIRFAELFAGRVVERARHVRRALSRPFVAEVLRVDRVARAAATRAGAGTNAGPHREAVIAAAAKGVLDGVCLAASGEENCAGRSTEHDDDRERASKATRVQH